MWLDGVSKNANFSLTTTGYQIGRAEFGGNSSSTSTPTAGSKLFVDSMKISSTAIGAFSPVGVSGDYVVAPFYSEPSQAFFNGARLTPVTDQVLTDAGTFFYDADLERTYLRLPGGVAPTGHTVEIGRRQYVIQVTGKSDLWFVGLNLKHSDTASSGGISLHNCSKIIIEKIKSYDNFGAGVNITDDSDNNTVRNCSLENNERDLGGGVRIDTGSDDNIIEHNEITGLGGNGIYIKGDVATSLRNILRYNKIDNVFDSGIYLNTDVNETQIIGNRISRPHLSLGGAAGGNGIHVAINSSNNVLKNNVISDVQAHGIQLRQDVADNVVSNNTVYNAGLSGAGGAPVRNSYFNNVIHTAGTACIWFDSGSSLAAGIEMNFNLCYNLGKPYAVARGQNFTSVAALTAVTQWELLVHVPHREFK